MKRLLGVAFLFAVILTGCSTSSDAKSQKQTADLVIFHSNDLTGYLTECG